MAHLWKIYLFKMVILHSKLLNYQKVTTNSSDMATEHDRIFTATRVLKQKLFGHTRINYLDIR